MAALGVFISLILLVNVDCAVKYEPNWESIDSRPIPPWFDQAKFGIFIHWGVYSVPSFGSEWFWYYWDNNIPDYVNFMKKNYPPDFQYQDFAPHFTAEFFDPKEWTEIISASGAKYVVLTAKHHEGFTLWGSKHSWNWNSVDVGPERDLVDELSAAVRSHSDLRFGLYYSLFEFFNPLYVTERTNGFKTNYFTSTKTMPELYDLVQKYKPEVVWSDGDWLTPDTYWNSTVFLAWLYNDSPVKDTVVTNDRWGIDCRCKHGGYYTCSDRYQPGYLVKHKWENCMTIDKKSWGYRRNAPLQDYFSIQELISILVETVSCGGNLLMNIGPTRDGRISPIFEERLREMGTWLKVNGEGIYNSTPWRAQNDSVTPNIWYTFGPQNKAVYAFLLQWPDSGSVVLGEPEPTDGQTQVELLGYGALKWESVKPKGIKVLTPMSSLWVGTLKITGAT